MGKFHFQQCPASRACWPLGDDILLMGRDESGVITIEAADAPQDEHDWTDQGEHTCARCGHECLCDVVDKTLRWVVDTVQSARSAYATQEARESARLIARLATER